MTPVRKAAAKTGSVGIPPRRLLLNAVESGEAGIILDEQIMYRLAVEKGLEDTLFPLRPALDAAAVERLLKEGVLTAEEVASAIFLKHRIPT